MASLAAIGVFILLNVTLFNGFGTDPVIASPARAQVTGTWVGTGGTKLVLLPDGTFTASSLPVQAESSSPSGSPALIYYLGDPDDWSNQYAFTRQ